METNPDSVTLRPKGCRPACLHGRAKNISDEMDVPVDMPVAQAGSDAGGTPPGGAAGTPVMRYGDRVNAKSGPVSRL